MPSLRHKQLFPGGICCAQHGNPRTTRTLLGHVTGAGKKETTHRGDKFTAIPWSETLLCDSLLNPLCDALNFSFLL